MKTLRLPEWAKNLLIVVLSLSALFLFLLSPLYVNSPLVDLVSRLLTGRDQGTHTVSVSTSAALPARIAVNTGNGRCGIQYDSDSLDEAFVQVSDLLGEAIGTAETPFVITEERWQEALTDQGIYFDFGASLPFSSLAGWLSGGEADPLLTANVRRVLITLTHSTTPVVWLCYQDADSGIFYGCITRLSGSSHLLPALAAFTPNGALFAFEDAAYASCTPYTLITAAPQPREYTSAPSLSTETTDSLHQVLSALSFSGASGNSFDGSGGTVYLAGQDTLQLTQEGTLHYSGTDGSRYPVNVREGDSLPAACLEVAHQLTTTVLEPLCGSARPTLHSVRQTEEGLFITYAYRLDGVSLWLGQEGWAAQFLFRDGALIGYTMKFRSYTATGLTTPVLPPLQAAAMLDVLTDAPSELLLTYRDPGGESSVITAGWIAG